MAEKIAAFYAVTVLTLVLCSLVIFWGKSAAKLVRLVAFMLLNQAIRKVQLRRFRRVLVVYFVSLARELKEGQLLFEIERQPVAKDPSTDLSYYETPAVIRKNK